MIKYTVDIIESGVVRLISDDGKDKTVDISFFSPGIKENDVVVYCPANGTYSVDAAETELKTKKTENRLSSLFNRRKS